VFADWFDEHGDAERAEFIRVQCELARLDEWDARRWPLAAREAELLKAHEARWREALPKLDGVSWGTFRRGFVSSVRVRALEAHLDAAVAAAPVEMVWVHTLTARSFKALFKSPARARVRGLNLAQKKISNSLLEQFAASPHLGALTELGLGGNYLSEVGVRALADCPRLTRLRVLDLSNNQVNGRGALALVASPHLP
jgi:hypothetical protein